MANYLLTFSGTINNVPDGFNHTLAVVSGASAQAVSDDVNAQFSSEWTVNSAYRGLHSTGMFYVETSVAEILDLQGPETALSAAVHTQFEPELEGGSPTDGIPQVSCVVSLTAGTYPNGVPLRGRFYLPPFEALEQSGGLISSTSQSTIINFWNTVVLGVSGAGHTPAVWSRKLGALQPITMLRVGRVLDTMRSRNNAATENYVSTGI